MRMEEEYVQRGDSIHAKDRPYFPGNCCGSAATYLGRMLAAVPLVVVALINLAPVVGVFSAERISSAYGVGDLTPDLEILLRHRAVLFGIVGGLLLVSVGYRELRWPAMAGAAVSMTSFVALAMSVGGYGIALRRIVIADTVAMVLLGVAVVIELREAA